MERLDLDSLRIEIERVQSRARTIAVSSIVAFIALYFFGFVRPVMSQPTNVRAQRIEVVDGQGRVRILIAVDAIGIAEVSIKDPQGNERALLAVLPDGSGEFTFRDLQGRQRLGLEMLPAGSSSIVIKDSQSSALFRAP